MSPRGAVTTSILNVTVPVSALASLLSYEEIKKILPWLARIISTSPRLAAIVQNSLPSLALITFNGVLPFLLSCQCISPHIPLKWKATFSHDLALTIQGSHTSKALRRGAAQSTL